jgi:hypothetical protein
LFKVKTKNTPTPSNNQPVVYIFYTHKFFKKITLTPVYFRELLLKFFPIIFPKINPPYPTSKASLAIPI